MPMSPSHCNWMQKDCKKIARWLPEHFKPNKILNITYNYISPQYSDLRQSKWRMRIKFAYSVVKLYASYP